MKKEKHKDIEKEVKPVHRFTVDLEDDLWESLKIRAVKERATMREIIIALIKEYLKKG